MLLTLVLPALRAPALESGLGDLEHIRGIVHSVFQGHGDRFSLLEWGVPLPEGLGASGSGLRGVRRGGLCFDFTRVNIDIIHIVSVRLWIKVHSIYLYGLIYGGFC